jgi:general secretion pathway protein J
MRYVGHGKSPYAALHFPLRHCGVRNSTPHSSGVARLASGAFCVADSKYKQQKIRKMPCDGGFTLIEILLAIFILGIVMSTVYASYTGTFRIIRDTQEDAEIYGMARNALDRMARDLQSVAPWRGAFTFITKADTLGSQEFLRLTFRAAAHVAFNDRDVPGGISVIEYRIEEGTEKAGYVLVRSDDPYRDPGKEQPLPGGYLLSDRIEAVTYRFYDEAGKEYETWDSGGQVETQRNKTPAGILIGLSLINTADKERPYRFTTRVRIPFNRVVAS